MYSVPSASVHLHLKNSRNMSALRLLLLSAVVLMLSTITLTDAMRYGSGPKSCCFEFASQQIKLNSVKSYAKTSQRCPVAAVLFTMKKGRQVCAKPSDPWVQKYIEILNSKVSGGQGPL